MKRTILIGLVLALLLSCFAPAVSAAGAAYVLDSASASKGEQVTLTLSIQNNPGIISLRFRIVYDETQLQLVGVSDEGLLNGYVQPSPTVSSPYILRWADSLATVNNTKNGAVAKLTFKIVGDQAKSTVTIEHVEARNATGSKQTFADCSATVSSTHNHSWGSWTETTPAACETAGVKTRTCSACGESETQTIPAKGHQEVVDAAVAATCTTAGRTEGKHCSVCGKVLTAQTTIPAKGHSWKAATCTAPKTCSVCGATEGKALGHDYSVAQHDSSSHWTKCSRCGSTTAKVSHSFTAHSCDAAAKCTGCDYVKPAGQHSYGSYLQDKAPTCTEPGSETGTCTICGQKDTRTVPAAGHKAGQPVRENEVAATEDKDGSYDEVIYCTVCKAELSRTTKVIPKGDDDKKPSKLPLLGVLGAGQTFPFRDVPENAWYYDAVKSAWQNQLINGVTATEFRPKESMTVAQAVKLAAALHQLNVYGKVTLKNGRPNWYSTYVNYAVDNGLIENAYGSYTAAQMNAPVTRAEFVHILHDAVDDLWAKNTVKDNAIPDVKTGDAFAAEIYDFYRAGILTGSDAKGTFHPTDTIKRSEVAAILIRMYDVSVREAILLG